MSVSEYSESELLKRAVRGARAHRPTPAPRWVAIMDTFCLGSGYAVELCRLHDLDPDEMVHGAHCQACEQS